MLFRKQKSEELNKHKTTEDNRSTITLHDDSNWLISYADMMTLLCGFFIMLFSLSRMDESKFDAFKEAMVRQFGGNYVSVTKETEKFATQLAQELGIEKNGSIKSDFYGITIMFESTVFFDTSSAELSVDGLTLLKKLCDKITEQQKKIGKEYKIVAEGHTDSRPITDGLYPSNWELSGARADRVVRVFLEAGYHPQQMVAIGYADTRPLLPARTMQGSWNPEALEKNRRVVLRILDSNMESIPLPDQDTRAKSQ